MVKYFKIYTVTDKQEGYNTYDNFYPSDIRPVNIDSFKTEDEAKIWIKKHGSLDAKYTILPIYETTIDDYIS